MQQTMLVNAQREPLLSTPLLRSLCQLNRRFLELACAAGSMGEWGLHVPVDMTARFISLGDERREALAQCPYALFDIRFCDDRQWESSLQDVARWRVADMPDLDARSADFLRLALFYSWHLAQTQPLSAPLILGMTERTACELAKVTLDRLPALFFAHRHHLGLRWPTCRSFWNLLTAAQPGSATFRRTQLFGFQIAAAVRLGARCAESGVAVTTGTV